MSRLIAMVVVIAACYSGIVGAAESRPNVLFLFGDDLAWWALPATGNDEVRTSNFDRLAAAVLSGIKNVLLFHLTNDPLEMRDLSSDAAYAGASRNPSQNCTNGNGRPVTVWI